MHLHFVIAAMLLAGTSQAQPQLEAIRKNDEVIVRLPSDAGRFYVIDEARALPVWTESQVFNGTGALIHLTNDLSSMARYFRVRSFQAVQISKPGAALHTPLALSNSTARWNVTGEIPAGLAFSQGTFSGSPTADAAEKYSDGSYTNVLRLTIPGTGEQLDRESSVQIVHKVKLSFSRNIYADRPNGPSFGSICLKCHGSGFPPDFTPSAATLIGVPSGTGGACPPDWEYIVRGQPEHSLIYRKVASPTCGDRMPQGGPFYNSTQIDRLARWIAELGPGEID
jgi:hypothetical protein